MLVSGMFVAAGGERFVTIGNFHLPVNTSSENVGGGTQPYAYYYIDDISVVRCNVGVDEMGEGNEELGIYPNPVTESLTLTLSKGEGIVGVYNVLGECVLRTRITNHKKEIDVSLFSKGIYFVEVKTEKGIIRKKLIKE